MNTQDPKDALIRDLQDRVKRLEQRINDSPLFQRNPVDFDRRISPVTNFTVASTTPNAGSVTALLTFNTPSDLNVDHYEMWVSDTSSAQSQSPNLVASSKTSPVKITVVAGTATSFVVYCRTVNKNGLISALNASPTVTFTAASVNGVNGNFVYKDGAGANFTSTYVNGIRTV